MEESRQLAIRMRSNPPLTQMAPEQPPYFTRRMLRLITWMVADC